MNASWLSDPDNPLAACVLAGLLPWKASERAAGRALTLFLAFLALFRGSVFRAPWRPAPSSQPC